MLKNLQAEITRSGVSNEELASQLGITVRTLNNKLKGITEFQRDEMFKLRDLFFPKLGVEYLFYVEPTPPTLAETATEFLE